METGEPITVVWREMLTGIFSVLGRMARLAECRDLRTHCYFHTQVTGQLGWEKAHHALRTAHELVWSDWMRGTLGQQQRDVQLYLDDGPLGIAQTTTDWRESQPFLKFIPTSASAAERSLFLSNLGVILDLLHNQYSSDPILSTDEDTAANSEIHQQLVTTVRERQSDPDLSLKELSAEIHLSDRRLGRIFTEFAGQPFRQYLRNLRITEAAKLLLSSNHDVKAIAVLVGYRDCSHLCDDFRRAMRCTPGEFRAKHSQTEPAKRRCPIS